MIQGSHLGYRLKIFRDPVKILVVLGYWVPVKFYPCNSMEDHSNTSHSFFNAASIAFLGMVKKTLQ
jgi:hypothetical protein